MINYVSDFGNVQNMLFKWITKLSNDGLQGFPVFEIDAQLNHYLRIEKQPKSMLRCA